MSAPVKNTCPDIDGVIFRIKEAMDTALGARSTVEDKDLTDTHLYNIYHSLRGLDRMMEDLRTDNSKLRDWGHSLDDELATAAQTIADLEAQLEEKVNSI